MKTRLDRFAWIDDELEQIRALRRERIPLHIAGAPGPEVDVEGARLVHACSNNYLGLASDPRLVEAAVEATRRFGTGTGASRLVSGGTSLHREVEERLAAFKGTEDAIVFSSGYLANLGTIPVLAGRGDLILSDALNHASVIDACRISGARVEVYAHADPLDLEQRLIAGRGDGRTLVVSDTVFSMDGDVAPLADIVTACDRHGAILMVDEAHATGVLGGRGAGAVDLLGLTEHVPVLMGTLSKALGSAGGYVCGSRALVALLRNRARSYIFDTAPAVASLAAAAVALDVVAAEPERRARAVAHARALARGLRAHGYAVPEPAACIVPLILGDEERALAAAGNARERGVLAPAIRPPSVAPGSSRVRLTTMATHTEAMVADMIEAFRP